jgi:Mg2+ and Co2+ transporter CorA
MWGMNFQHIPWSAHPHAFWDLLAIQLGLAASLLVILRWRKLI